MLSTNVEVRDFSIVVVGEQNPSSFSLDFLKYNQIVPSDWELAMPPISTPPLSQFLFKNGVNILAQNDKVTFWETLDSNDIAYKVPEVVSRYIEIYPAIDYRAVGININSHIIIESKEDNQDTVLKKIISEGKWKTFQGESPSAVVQFTYQLDDGNLTITIQEAILQKDPNNEPLNILNFSANFHRDLMNIAYAEKKHYLNNAIQLYQADLNTFFDFIQKAFLE